jgi:hypothetical protein
MEQPANNQPSPAKIMQIGMGFWASKALLAAVQFKLFTRLAGGALQAREIKEQLSLGCTDRHIYDWLDTLVSLGLLKREGLLETARYSNTPDTEMFLDRNRPSYIGGILEMGNNRLYGFWGSLEEALQTGRQQNEGKDAKENNMNFFSDLYKDPVKLSEFMDAMSGIQLGNFMALTKKFDFSPYQTLADVGGADGLLSMMICRAYPQIHCTSFDLPPVEPLAKKRVEQMKMSDRITVQSGDFLHDALPQAQVITMGNIIHGMNEETKQQLIDKVYATLPSNGVFITIENIIDNDRRENTFGMLMSLNMLIENGDAFDYTPADFARWTKAAGFKRTEIIPLAGPTSAAVAYK